MEGFGLLFRFGALFIYLFLVIMWVVLELLNSVGLFGLLNNIEDCLLWVVLLSPNLEKGQK